MQALIGLGGVVVGAVLSGVLALRIERSRQRHEDRRRWLADRRATYLRFLAASEDHVRLAQTAATLYQDAPRVPAALWPVWALIVRPLVGLVRALRAYTLLGPTEAALVSARHEVRLVGSAPVRDAADAVVDAVGSWLKAELSQPVRVRHLLIRQPIKSPAAMVTAHRTAVTAFIETARLELGIDDFTEARSIISP